MSEPDCLQRGIFSSRDETFTLRHVLGAAEFLGTAAELWDWLGRGLACQSYAEEEGFEQDDEALQTAVDDYRYRKQLLDAEGTGAWLAARALSEEELFDALTRKLWRQRFAGELDPILAQYPPEPEELARALWPELIVHDRLLPPAVELARRVVAPELAAARPAAETPRAPPPVPPTPAALPAWVPDWARLSPEWERRLRALELSYHSVVRQALEPRRLEDALAARRLDLTRVHLRAARFTSLDAAREALLCVTQDGESFEQAAGRAQAAREDRELFLADTPEQLLPFLVSALPGETFLVEEEDAGSLVAQVAAKTAPTLEDPEVRARLERLLLERTFDPAVEEHIRWLCPLEG